MKPEIQISHLKTLIAIDEEGSFGAAAHRVGRTQSAVTQQMQILEQILETPLFVAKGRKRELTEAGHALLRHSREIISMCNYAIATSRLSQQTDVIKVGAPHEVAEDILPVALAKFALAWPSSRAIIHIERSPSLMEMLEEGRLDLAISTRRSENYDSTLLMKLPTCWISSKNWQQDKGVPWPLILTDEPSMFRRMALSALDLTGQDYVERITSPSLVGVKLAVAAGLGITARTATAFEDGVRVLDEKDGLPPLPDVSYYLHQSIEGTSPSSKDLFRLMVETAKELC